MALKSRMHMIVERLRPMLFFVLIYSATSSSQRLSAAPRTTTSSRQIADTCPSPLSVTDRQIAVMQHTCTGEETDAVCNGRCLERVVKVVLAGADVDDITAAADDALTDDVKELLLAGGTKSSRLSSNERMDDAELVETCLITPYIELLMSKGAMSQTTAQSIMECDETEVAVFISEVLGKKLETSAKARTSHVRLRASDYDALAIDPYPSISFPLTSEIFNRKSNEIDDGDDNSRRCCPVTSYTCASANDCNGVDVCTSALENCACSDGVCTLVCAQDSDCPLSATCQLQAITPFCGCGTGTIGPSCQRACRFTNVFPVSGGDCSC